MRFTWRKQPNEKGLASVCQSQRGAILKIDGIDVGGVYPLGKTKEWWYYVVCEKEGYIIPLRNTCNNTVNSMDEAKQECLKYVKECLKKE